MLIRLQQESQMKHNQQSGGNQKEMSLLDNQLIMRRIQKEQLRNNHKKTGMNTNKVH